MGMDETYSAAYLPPSEQQRARRLQRDQARPPQGLGWVMFAGTMIAIAGVVNAIYGVAAISNSDFFEKNADYIAGSLTTWGWVVLVVGVVQVCAAFAIWRGALWGRIVGVAVAAVNAVVQLMWLPSRPFAALALYALDLLVLYGLVRYGNLRSE